MSEEETKTTKEVSAPEDTAPQIKKTNKAFKVSLWIGIPTIALIIILWVFHEWLGYWIATIHKKYDFADNVCEWSYHNLPLWLVGKGFLRHKEDPYFPYYKKNALSFIYKYLNNSQDQIRFKAWKNLGNIISVFPENIQKEILFRNLVRAFHYEDRLIRFIALKYLCEYSNFTNSTSNIFKEIIKDETDRKIKEDIQIIVKYIPPIEEGRFPPEIELILKEKVSEDNLHREETEKNVQLFIKILREYHETKE